MNFNLMIWLKAFRLRTLPLALASIGLGSFLAAREHSFNLRVTLLCLLTTTFLQILSNLANDYGDFVNGADSIHREGPQRMVQSGNVSPRTMKMAIIIFSLLSAISGLLLIYRENIYFFGPLGIMAIIAAITYTAGKKPYGYAGLGDLSVFIFFGLTGVIGSYYLQTHSYHWQILLPAFSCGVFSVAVLNINNIRDIEADRLAGKNTIPVRIGREKARKYHSFLLASGLISTILYNLFEYKSIWQFSFLLIFPLLLKNLRAIQSKETPKDLDPYLKQMALCCLLFVLTFGIGNLIDF